jgi:hypothetical protein
MFCKSVQTKTVSRNSHCAECQRTFTNTSQYRYEYGRRVCRATKPCIERSDTKYRRLTHCAGGDR